jgi:hypothetical protein
MKLLKLIAREAVGLFIADAVLVLTILLWTVVVAFGLRSGLIGPAAAPVSIALGVAALLVVDVLKVARAKASPPSNSLDGS